MARLSVSTSQASYSCTELETASSTHTLDAAHCPLQVARAGLPALSWDLGTIAHEAYHRTAVRRKDTLGELEGDELKGLSLGAEGRDEKPEATGASLRRSSC